YKTIDGGASWTAISNKPYISSIAIDKLNSNLVFICTDPAISVSYIYRSVNAGATWTYISAPANKIIDLETDPNATGTVYAVRGSYTPGKQVYKSINSGTTWINITGDLPAIPVNTITIDAFNSNHLYVGTDLGVYLTTNGGINWNAFNDNLPLVVVQDMHYYKGDSTIRIGTHGRGVWKTKSAAAGSVNVVELPEAGISLSVFPNPSNADVVISYSVRIPGRISASVYNSFGQEIIQLMDSHQSAGNQSLQWNRKNALGQMVSPGVYYVRVVIGDLAYSRRIVIL
ncbi:MAG TPA: T9SS type A sorting domain-containing protein, partial [Bacteroidia bacterium]